MSRKINPKRLSINEEFVKYEILTASNDLNADVDKVTVAFFGIDSFLNTDIWINSLDQLMRVVNENTTTFDAIFVCEEISDALHVTPYKREEMRVRLKQELIHLFVDVILESIFLNVQMFLDLSHQIQ